MTASSPVSSPLIVHLVFSLGTGGLENGLVNLINRSSAYEFRHMVICLTSSGSFARRIAQNNVEIVELNKPEGHSLSTFIQLRELVKQYRPSIVHSRNLAALEFQVATLGIPGIKRVHGEHGRDINDPQGKNWKYNLLRRISRLWIDRYITVSRELELWLCDFIDVNPSIITRQANGVDCDVFSGRTISNEVTLSSLAKSLDIDGRYVIGTVGRLVAIKDQKTLISAFAKVAENYCAGLNGLCLVIVGDGPMRLDLEDHANALGVASSIRFCGERDNVPDLLKLMDVFVLPSIAEGVSNTLLEAMATALPVIATAVGGAPDIIVNGDNGFLVEVGASEQIAKKLTTCVEDQGIAREIGFNGRQTVERYYSWSVTIENYCRVYRELVGNHVLEKTIST
ncbi:MAG: sugar transferase [Cellvibrionaceae bacterium]|nr:sugar transferase [Cellvibrionaceae bacterium]|tara:strand:- start:33002 stop:34192 length:1191 start_codon:yes stop_codon:yes gene_type:complete